MAFNRKCFVCSRVIDGRSSQVKGKDLCHNCFDLVLFVDEGAGRPIQVPESPLQEISLINADEVIEQIIKLLRSAAMFEKVAEIEPPSFLVRLDWELQGIALALSAIVERERALTVQNQLLLTQLRQPQQRVGPKPVSNP